VSIFKDLKATVVISGGLQIDGIAKIEVLGPRGEHGCVAMHWLLRARLVKDAGVERGFCSEEKIVRISEVSGPVHHGGVPKVFNDHFWAQRLRRIAWSYLPTRS
jgi:hypothetical protein